MLQFIMVIMVGYLLASSPLTVWKLNYSFNDCIMTAYRYPSNGRYIALSRLFITGYKNVYIIMKFTTMRRISVAVVSHMAT